jgi:hypothetical protein
MVYTTRELSVETYPDFEKLAAKQVLDIDDAGIRRRIEREKEGRTPSNC